MPAIDSLLSCHHVKSVMKFYFAGLFLLCKCCPIHLLVFSPSHPLVQATTASSLGHCAGSTFSCSFSTQSRVISKNPNFYLQLSLNKPDSFYHYWHTVQRLSLGPVLLTSQAFSVYSLSLQHCCVFGSWGLPQLLMLPDLCIRSSCRFPSSLILCVPKAFIFKKSS